MHKLFSFSFKRIANRLNQQELNALNVGQALQANKIPANGEGFLYRLPREELKHIANIPCPINNLQETSSQSIIASSKAIRHNANINEDKICAKCPFKTTCHYSKLPFDGTIDNAAKDLLIFWSGLSNLYKPEDIYFRQWASAYKLGDSIIAALNDLSEQGKEIQQYNRLRIYMLQQHKEIMDKKSLQKVEKLGANSIDEKFKLIQQLTKDQSFSQPEKTKQDAAKMTNQHLKKDFSFDDVEQFQPKTKIAKETYKQKRLRQPQKSLNNTIGYQSIEKRQNMDSKPSQKPKPQKVEKYYNQKVVQELDFEMKTPKIKEKRQPALNKFGKPQKTTEFQNKKGSLKGEKSNYDNRKYQNTTYNKFNQNNRNNGPQDKNERYDRPQNKKYDFKQKQNEFNGQQYDERKTSNNYNKYQDRKGQNKFSDYRVNESQNYRSYEKQGHKSKQNAQANKWRPIQTFKNQDTIRQPSKARVINQNQKQLYNNINEAKQKSSNQATSKASEGEKIQQKFESQGRSGRNVRRRSRSTSGNVQTE